MARFFVACVVLLCPVLSAWADDPKPDVVKLKDEVELLDAKLDVWKAKVAGAEKTFKALNDIQDKLLQAERAGAIAFTERIALTQTRIKNSTELDVFRAEHKVAEVMLTQAKRRLAVAEKAVAAPVKPAKTYAVSFVNKPWADVFDWFAGECGLVSAVKEKPPGTFTFKPTAGKRFTLTEIVDVMNEAMAPTWVLVRGDKSLTLLQADEKPDPDLFPRIDLADLGNYGRTEIVCVQIALGSLNRDETLPQLKVLLSSFGTIQPFGKSAVMIRDKTGNIRRIQKELESLVRH